MKIYAIENEMLKQPQKMLISSFKLENGTVITPLFNFYMEHALQCTKIYRFVQYSPRKCFKIFFSQWLMIEKKEMKTRCQEI